MANVFKRDDKGVKKLLQSAEMLKMVEGYAIHYAPGKEIISFIGMDRAKTLIKGVDT